MPRLRRPRPIAHTTYGAGLAVVELFGSELFLVAGVLLGLGLTTVAIFRDLDPRRRIASLSHYVQGGVT